MNGKDILLYTIFTTGVLYGLWVILNMVWFGILLLYRYISDEITFYRWYNKK